VGEVDILTADGGIMAVYVDAGSGSVITTEEKMIAQQKTMSAPSTVHGQER